MVLYSGTDVDHRNEVMHGYSSVGYRGAVMVFGPFSKYTVGPSIATKRCLKGENAFTLLSKSAIH